MDIRMILLTLLILSILILVHEWGHYFVAKRMDVIIEEFAIGMGPKLFSKKGKETEFSIRAFLIGGFCKMRGEGELEESGEDNANAYLEDPRSFMNKTKIQRALILFAGAFMNFIFAYICMIIIYLMKGNFIFVAFKNAFFTTLNFIFLMYKSLWMMFTGHVSVNEIAGPIGMVGLVGDFYQMGIIALLSLTALVSINLAVINLLPFPALDGGQILILFIEKISKKEISTKVLSIINIVGLVLLLMFAVLISINDIRKIIAV